MSVVSADESEYVDEGGSNFVSEVGAEAAEAGSQLLENFSLESLQGAFVSVTSGLVESGASVFGAEEQAEACSDVTTFGGALGGSAAGLVGGLFLGPLAGIGLGLLGAASGAATYGAACTAALSGAKAFKSKDEFIYEGIYQSETGANTFPLPASVWDQVVAPVVGASSGPAVGRPGTSGAIRPSVAVTMPVELERLQARQQERQAVTSNSALLLAGLAGLAAYKYL